jgi:hypothetical protein
LLVHPGVDEDLETSDDHTPPAGASEFLEELARQTESDLIGELPTERLAHPRLIPRRFARAASPLITTGVPLRDFALGLATVPRRRR